MASLSSTHSLTLDNLNKILLNQCTRMTVNYLDDSSTKANIDSSFWESSEAETDSTAIDDLQEKIHMIQIRHWSQILRQHNHAFVKEQPGPASFSQVLRKVVLTVMQVHLKVKGKEAKITERLKRTGRTWGKRWQRMRPERWSCRKGLSFKGQSR